MEGARELGVEARLWDRARVGSDVAAGALLGGEVLRARRPRGGAAGHSEKQRAARAWTCL